MPVALSAPFNLPPRWRAAALLAAAVLALHALLLGNGWVQPAGARPTTPATSKARSVTPLLMVRAVQAGATVTAQATPRAPPRATLQTATVATSSPSPTRPPARPPVDVKPDPAALALDEQPAPAAVANPISEGTDVPLYATQPPSAATLHFEVRRGSQAGQAVLAWRPDNAAYLLTLDNSAFGVQALGSASQGSFDAAGMAPERFVDKRRGREVRATNFQRQANVISFSGPPQTLPLWPGSQDRLSWMLQLPAIVRANPALAAPGAQVQMRVVGSRGEADVWVFTLLGFEDLQLPAGDVLAALRWQRLPRRPYDTLVEVWLDPARQHLPVRARLGIKPSGESTEFLLQRLE